VTPPGRRPILELCVQGISSALTAAAAGADRIELCENLSVGGVTPSAGIIAAVCQSVNIPVHILIRPREGDFVYTAAELTAIRHDIQTARSLGASGVVLGVLDSDQTIDTTALASLVELARPLSVTFHRAFDEVPDPSAALESLVALGVDRILTSAGAPTALQGRHQLFALNAQAQGRIVILAAGRVDPQTIPLLLRGGLTEFHAGSAAGPPGRTDLQAARALVAATGLPSASVHLPLQDPGR
jgi:copper homeostasis protein